VTSGLTVRRHGDAGPPVVVLHGGPGAPGRAAALARELGRDHRVLEPHQRLAGAVPLTVAGHVADLRAVLADELPGERPALVGESWGAMLALAFAAEHPNVTRSLALVGCGTFDERTRAVFRTRLDARLGPRERALLSSLETGPEDLDERLRAMAALVMPAYAHDLLPHADETAAYDARGNAESWNDMLRLQRDGTYPAAFAAIDAPVLMLHGADDPHPGELVRASLAPHVARLKYVELKRCGHEPWHERHARGAFFALLRAWLA
jgi:pimeloyl-ACP methyl ester carboxylesterase